MLKFLTYLAEFQPFMFVLKLKQFLLQRTKKQCHDCQRKRKQECQCPVWGNWWSPFGGVDCPTPCALPVWLWVVVASKNAGGTIWKILHTKMFSNVPIRRQCSTTTEGIMSKNWNDRDKATSIHCCHWKSPGQRIIEASHQQQTKINPLRSCRYSSETQQTLQGSWHKLLQMGATTRKPRPYPVLL